MRKIILTTIILFLFVITSESQNLDSLFNSYVNLKNRTIFDHPAVLDSPWVYEEKCGFGLTASVRTNYVKFTLQQQSILSNLFQREERHTSFITPGGFFRVHHDTSGQHNPEYDLNELAIALDSTYNFEINFLGYPIPPSDNGLGSDDKYDVYIKNLGGGLYGFTEPETVVSQNTWSSFIVIENDFNNYFTTGINAARVTVAHEFHHAIQIGNYIFRDSDLFYFELTSTSMEEFVYDDINDYYAYMSSYFRSPGNSLPENSGYNIAVWNIFLRDRYYSEDPTKGYNIIKRSWELMPNNKAVAAIALALLEYGNELKYLFNEFGVWTYFTNYRAKDNHFFEEGANYPLIRPAMTMLFTPPGDTLTVFSKPVSNSFLVFPDFSRDLTLPDTLVSIITNSDVTSAANNPNATLSFDYFLYSKETAGTRKLNAYYYSKISSANNSFLSEAYIFNNDSSGQVIITEEIDFAYPQPFRYSINNSLSIPTVDDPSRKADLNIYSPSMNLVYSGRKDIIVGSKKVILWDGKDNNGNKLASGVYIYVTKAGDNVKKGKIVIYNE